MKLKAAIVLVLIFSLNIGRSAAQEYPPHRRDSSFYNPYPGYQERSFTDFLRYFIFERPKGSASREAGGSIPEKVDNDGKNLRDNHDQFTVTWIGHSSLLIQMDGINILADPVFSDRASPFTFIGPRRLTPPGIKFSGLPPIDVVILSHDHYDHLDKNTLKKLGNEPFYIVPLGVGRILYEMGIDHYREYDWGENILYRGIDFICAPAQHFSGRALFNRNKTLWTSWVVKGKENSFYFGGDSGYAPFYRQIGEKYGPFDAAALPIGPTEPRDFMRQAHLDPEDAIRAYFDLKAEIFIPIHWGTFSLGTDPPDLAPLLLFEEINKRSLPAKNFWIPKLGETRFL